MLSVCGAALSRRGRSDMFIEDVIFKRTKIPILKAVLDVTSLRQRIIANNVANVNTVGYRKKEVDFERYLESFVKKPKVVGLKTDVRHFPIPGGTGAPRVYEPETGPNTSGVNNVDIDMEMANLAENQLFFNTGARLISRQIEGLRKSIVGRPQV